MATQTETVSGLGTVRSKEWIAGGGSTRGTRDADLAVGFPAAPPFPNVAIPDTIVSLIGHVVYAVPVAVAYALVAEK